MLHLSGLGRDEVMDIARREIDIMYRNGVNTLLVENYLGDKTDVENALKCLYEVYPDTEPLANGSLTALPGCEYRAPGFRKSWYCDSPHQR
jgi:hypothetical protein